MTEQPRMTDEQRLANIEKLDAVMRQLNSLVLAVHSALPDFDAVAEHSTQAIAVADQCEAFASEFHSDPLCAAMRGMADGLVRFCDFADLRILDLAESQARMNAEWHNQILIILRRYIAALEAGG